jgi:hypothetical protein
MVRQNSFPFVTRIFFADKFQESPFYTPVYDQETGTIQAHCCIFVNILFYISMLNRPFLLEPLVFTLYSWDRGKVSGFFHLIQVPYYIGFIVM